MSIIAQNIVLVRHLAGMSQAEFGKEIGVSRNALITYENGRTPPKGVTLQRIAKIAGVSAEDLTGRLLKEADINVTNAQTDYIKIRKAELDAMQTLISSMAKHIERLENQNK